MESEAPLLPVNNKKKRKGQLPLALLISELKCGKTIPQIAKQYNLTPEGVRTIARVQGISIKTLHAYKEHKADLLAFKQNMIMEAMGPDKIKAASLRDQATTFNILHNAERLERGQSTDNISFAAISRELSELEQEEVRLRNLLLSDASAPTPGSAG